MNKIKNSIFIFLLIFFSIFSEGYADLYPLSDLEGSKDELMALVDQGILKFDEKGQLDFTDGKSKVLFGGDLVDRAADNIKLVRWLTAFKKKYPDRVTLLWGNREVNKLTIHDDIKRLKTNIDPEYASWFEWKLKEQGKAIPDDPKAKEALFKKLNTEANRVEHWLDNHSAGGGLEFHRKELEELTRKKVTRAQAAKDYLKFMSPDGEFFEYLRQGQVAFRDGNVTSVHGGITQENMGRVPGKAEVFKNVDDWFDNLNKWGQNQLKSYESRIRGNKPVSSLNLVGYGDAVWDPNAIDPVTGRKGAVLMNDQSVIYPYRYKEGGNIRMPDEKVIEYLKKSGIDTLVLHHTPAGNVPQPLKDKKKGFLTLMNDTSFGGQGQEKLVRIGEDGLHVKGVMGEGITVDYTTSPTSDDFVGTITEDGKTIVGRSANGDYATFSYYEGFKLDEGLTSAEDIKKAKPKAPYAEVESERLVQEGVFKKTIEEKGKRFLTLDSLDAEIGSKKVIVESGFSRFGQSPVSESEMIKSISDFYDKFDPKEIVILSGGTDVGAEKYVHEYATKKGIKVIGFIQGGAVPAEVNLVDDLVIAGRAGDWDSPLKASIHQALDRNGTVVFRGGGATVTDGITLAARVGADFHLMTGPGVEVDGLPGDGGASNKAAKDYPGRTFTNANELVTNVKTEKVGIYTGSFDPPHAGHENIVRQMKAKYGLDKVYVVPDRTVEYKPGMQSVADREAMVKALFRDTPGIDVLTPEMANRLGKGEMWDVIKSVEGAHPDAKLFNIMGTDTYDWYKTLPAQNRNPKVTLLVNEREGGKTKITDINGQKAVSVNLADQGYSSTAIRKSLASGNVPAELDPRVASYIKDKGLYGTGPETKTPEEIIDFFKKKGKKVVTFVGFSGAGYQDEKGMLAKAKEILSGLDPRKTIVNIGATEDGIGAVYRVAKGMGFETSGIVSELAKKYGGLSPSSDTNFYVKDETWGGYRDNSKVLNPTSRAMVESTDLMVGIGGGQVGADELDAARTMRKDMLFYEAEMDREKAIAKAKKNKQPIPKDFRGEAHQAIIGKKPSAACNKCVRGVVQDLVLRRY